jgi:large subunit ribosomal protein L15
MNLNDVNRGIHRNKSRKRLGRGIGSGQGKTAGRGHKGQHSRSGSSFSPVFEGGQMPLVRRIPKRGFNNRFAKTVHVINIADLEKCFEGGDEVTVQSLRAKKLAKGRFDMLKVLGTGNLTKKLKVTAHRFSQSASEKIQQAGGEVVLLSAPAPVVKNKQKKKTKKQ